MPERWISCQKFVDENTQSPPIYRRRVTLVLDHLWGEILGSSAERICLDGAIAPVPQPLSESKIDELDMALAVQQKILWL